MISTYYQRLKINHQQNGLQKQLNKFILKKAIISIKRVIFQFQSNQILYCMLFLYLLNMKANHQDDKDHQSLLKTLKEEFIKDLREFTILVKTWRNNYLCIKADNSSKALFTQYASYLEQANNVDALVNSFQLEQITYKEDLKNIKNQKEVFLRVSFLHRKQWKLNFNKIFIQKMSHLKEQTIFQIFLLLNILGEGYLISPDKPKLLQAYQMVSKLGLRYYTHRLYINNDVQVLLFTIGIHKLPHYTLNGILQSFSYKYVLTCEDIIHNFIFQNQKKINSLINELESYYEEDPKIHFSKNELVLNEQVMNKQLAYYQINNNGKKKQLIAKIFPPIYKKRIIMERGKENQGCLQIEQFQFQLEKYKYYRTRLQYIQFRDKVFQNSMVQMLQLETEKSKKIQFKKHSRHLQILEKIPNFKYALTNQQRQVICSNGNLIVVGRSGTGKTTCAMLRLYGIEFSIKMKQYNSRKRQKQIIQTPQKCIMALLDEIQLTKNIFLTFSGILIDEIQKQYNDMIYQLKEKHSQKCKICQKTLTFYTSSAENQDPIDKLRRIKVDQENKVVSLNSIQIDDFPGFFTIQNFIKIIDKTIQRPFFVQQKQKHQTKNIEIQYSNINLYDYQSREIVLQKQLKAVYVDYTFFLHHIWQNLPKQLTKATKQYCLLTPSVVWSEIFSILKGSIKSYLCPKGYISLKMYIENSQSIFQSQLIKAEEYKQKVYKILKSYHQWCKHEKAFDLMDVVNHNLRQIEFYGYSGPKINYMFVDQVQDLTASTTLLISKMVINNIFYCGDTAQAITKGVSFRFQDLKMLFNQKHCKYALNLQPPQDIQNLTVNFRSHNSIIQLANSIVTSIQILFPTSINKLKKQKSDLIGPKPFLILNQNDSMIFQLVCSPSLQEQMKKDFDLRQIILESQLKNKDKNASSNKYKRQKRKRNRQVATQVRQQEEQQKLVKSFNNEQVVIVRNLQQKQRLPQSLTKGIVLTPQTAKGLEYDQIILYNFFSSCPIYEKWNALFQHLECLQLYQNEQQFLKQLTRRNEQENNRQEELLEQTKQTLGYDKQKKQYRTWNIKAKQSIKGITINLYHELQTQLKILYTIITRARSVFIIYDSKIPKYLLRLWQKMNLVIEINQSNVQICHEDIREYVEINQKHVKYINQNEKWMKAGSQMLARKDFENAKKCYINIKRYDLVERIQAYQLQIIAQRQLYRIRSDEEKLLTYQKDDRKIIKVKIEKQKKQAYKIYSKAVAIYQRWQRFADTAQIYFKTQNYPLALEYYQKQDNSCNYYKMAVCYKNMKNYNEALVYFKKIQNVKGIIQSYIELEQQQLLFQQFINHPQYYEKYGFQITPQKRKKIISEAIRKTINTQPIEQQLFIQNKNNYVQVNYVERQASQIVLTNLINSYESLRDHFMNISKANKLNKDKKNNILMEIQQYDNKFKEIIQKKRQNQQTQHNLTQKQKQIKYNLQGYQLFRLKPEEQKKKISYSKQLQQLRASLLKMKQEIKQIDKQLNNANQMKKQKQSLLSKIQLKIKQNQEYLPQQQNQKIISFLSKKILNYKEAIKTNINKMQASMKDQEQNNQEINSKVICLLDQILKKSEILIQYAFQTENEDFPHKFIHQMFKKLKNSSTLSLLKKCDFVGNNIACLLICKYQKQFIGLQIKYIQRSFLQFSRNYNKKRHYKDEIYQNQSILKQAKQQNQIKLFIKMLNIKRLRHKVPSFIFNDSIYYESMIGQIIFGLILQGFYKQILHLFPENIAWRLSYLFSSDNCMKPLIQKMYKTEQNGAFLFIKDKNILKNHSQALMTNLASLQKIYFMYDQYQSNPFLSKRKRLDNFDVDQETVQQIYNKEAKELIEIMRQQHKQISIRMEKDKELIQLLENQKGNKNRQQIVYCLAKMINIQESVLKYLQEKRSFANSQLLSATMTLRQKTQIQNEIELYELQKDTVKLKSLKKQYGYKLKSQIQAFDNIKKWEDQIKDKKKIIQKIKNIKYKIQRSSTEQIHQIQQLILLKKQQLQKLDHLLPQLKVKNQEQLFQNIVRKIMDEKRQDYLDKSIKSIKDNNMQAIFNRSNIPEGEQYQFINNFKNQNGNQYINYYKTKIYQKVICDGVNIQQLEKDINKSIQVCNVIMFYLAYIFNEEFQSFVNKLFDYMNNQFEKNKKRYISNIKQSITQMQRHISAIEQKIKNTYFWSRDKLNNLRLEKKNVLAQKQYCQKLIQQQNLKQSPHKWFDKFLQIISNKIVTRKQPNDTFLNILFGIFRCKIIKQCQILDFLANQYVLVEKNSIVIDMLKEGMFAYYFDQQDKNILCRFTDIKRIIIAYIIKNHLKLPNNKANQESINKKISIVELGQTKLKYISQSQKKQDQRILKITQIHNRSQKYIEQVYNKYYLTVQLVDRIKSSKIKMLQYLLQNQFKYGEAFFLSTYQLREYHFLQKILSNLKQFNYIILKEVIAKLHSLQEQFIKWIER